MDLARDRQIKIIERAIMPAEMAGFEECFLTGNRAEVTPVGEVGPYPLQAGRDHAHVGRGLRETRSTPTRGGKVKVGAA